MSDVTRRGVMAGAATATAAAMMGEFSWSTPAHAQAPMAGKQAASFYRYKVGDFEVTVVADGVTRFKLPPTFVSNVDTAEVKKALGGEFLRHRNLQQQLHADRCQHRQEPRGDRHRHGRGWI